MPFTDMSAARDQEFFCEGMSEEIIQRLARGTRLRVISRTTSLQLRGERKAEAAQREAELTDSGARGVPAERVGGA